MLVQLSMAKSVLKQLEKTPKRDLNRGDNVVLTSRVSNEVAEALRRMADQLDTTTSRLMSIILEINLSQVQNELKVVSPKTREKGRSTT